MAGEAEATCLALLISKEASSFFVSSRDYTDVSVGSQSPGRKGETTGVDVGQWRRRPSGAVAQCHERAFSTIASWIGSENQR
jgi:hypothetical protein